MKIGFIGCGNMGSALAASVCKNKGYEVLLFDPNKEKIDHVIANNVHAYYATSEQIATECAFVFLAVKPNMIEKVLTSLKNTLNKSTVIVSMAAGVSIEKLSKMLLEGTPIIRIMPNTPVAVSAGMVLWCANTLAEPYAEQFEKVLENAGILMRMEERLIDSGSALSGCGPAFVYMFIDALADGGVAHGLAREDALILATQTVFGSAEMMLKTGKHPSVLREEVCSPGGSTIEGVYTLEKNGFKGTVMEAISESYKKTKQLGK